MFSTWCSVALLFQCTIEYKMDRPAKKRKTNTTEKALQHFEFLRVENGKHMYQCNICKKESNGTKHYNLTSHLLNVHKGIYDALIQNDDVINFKRQKLLLNCVELVSVNGRAFKSLNDSAITAFNEDLLDELRLAGQPINLKDKTLTEVKDLLQIVSTKVREKIQLEANGHPLCLMLDIGTCGNRSILGIRIQFILNGKLILRSIGMVELKDSHTGVYLSGVIVKQFEEFGINCRQIVTITTDNGANVLKTVRDIDEHLRKVDDDAQIFPKTPSKKKTNVERNQKEIDLTDDDAFDREVEAALALPDEITDDDAYAILFDETASESGGNFEDNQVLLNAITDELNAQYGINIVWNIASVPCNAHTLQLGVGDSFKETSIQNQNVMKLAKKIAKFLRLESTRRCLESAGITYSKPRLEVVTRWCTEYLMVIHNYVL